MAQANFASALRTLKLSNVPATGPRHGAMCNAMSADKEVEKDELIFTEEDLKKKKNRNQQCT